MGFHTFDAERAANLNDPARYEYLSVDELLALLTPAPDDRVLDLGSGTGFYTDDVAAHVGSVVGVDVQATMHRRYRARGVPSNVDLVTAEASALPFADGVFDAVFSTMTYHEFADEVALAELRRVLGPDGRLAIGDWTAAGKGARGPPLIERFDAATATDHLRDAGFDVVRAVDRRETFVVAARVR
ncbi:MAG: class I SAM-dependent methyltransferase [Haloarculaceae archaeon]